jgi:hypothetical protein
MPTGRLLGWHRPRARLGGRGSWQCVIGAQLAGRAVARLLFGVAPNDVATVVGVSALTGVVSVGPVGSRPVARRRSTGNRID